jgi:DNA processing protein
VSIAGLSRDELIDWLRLIGTEGIGPITFKQLLNKHGSAREALRALSTAPKKYKIPDPDPIERELQTAARDDIRALPSCEVAYPEMLRQIDDAPPVLWVRGDAEVLHRPCIGVVGARNASLNGKKFAKKLSHDLAEAGYVVVSGLARGIDGAAHEGALAQGTTIAVLASGVDIIYPPEHRALYQKILASGAVVSEQMPSTEPQAGYFPRRNRIISGLSKGVIIVEATLKSGSLITARQALEQGREVFAVPGSPLDPRSEGPNSLIRDGAVLVRSAEDILEVLGHPEKKDLRLKSNDRDESQDAEIYTDIDPDTLKGQILQALGASPVAVDELLRQCQVSAASLTTLLLEMELEGTVERYPGNRVARIGKV